MNPNQCHREPTEEEKTKIKFYKQSNEPHKGQNMNSVKSIIAALCALALANALISQASPIEQQAQQVADNGDDLIPFGSDGSLFLAGSECGPNETLMPGVLPTCEPTCKNPRPICPKVFFSSLDVVPCFCNKPLVRNEQTRQCVQLSECPK